VSNLPLSCRRGACGPAPLALRSFPLRLFCQASRGIVVNAVARGGAGCCASRSFAFERYGNLWNSALLWSQVSRHFCVLRSPDRWAYISTRLRGSPISSNRSLGCISRMRCSAQAKQCGCAKNGIQLHSEPRPKDSQCAPAEPGAFVRQRTEPQSPRASRSGTTRAAQRVLPSPSFNRSANGSLPARRPLSNTPLTLSHRRRRSLQPSRTLGG
jgi:hypothetical protein